MEPLTINKLKEMDRNWVWVERIGEHPEGIKRFINGYGFVLAPEGYVKVCEAKFMLDDYGKTWNAFSRRPREDILEAKWEGFSDNGVWTPHCSNCGYASHFFEHKHCPNCGANMKLK